MLVCHLYIVTCSISSVDSALARFRFCDCLDSSSGSAFRGASEILGTYTCQIALCGVMKEGNRLECASWGAERAGRCASTTLGPERLTGAEIRIRLGEVLGCSKP